jgi:parallel beta-helix repeat protein
MDNEGYGMSLFSSAHPILIESCLISQNSGPGVLINESCSATIKGNELKYNELGVDVQMANPRIEANHICFNFSDGVVLKSDTDTPCRGLLTANEIYENENGVVVTGLLCNPEISENVKIGHNRRAGVRVQEYAVVKIYKNMIFENVHQGVLLTNGTSASILQNTIYGNLRANIAFGDGDVTIIENKIYNGRCEGIFMMNSRGVIRDNDVYECNDGILSVSSRPELQKNRVYQNRRTGVTLADKTRALVYENQIHHNVECGLYVRDTSKAVIKGNTLRENGIQISFTSSKKLDLKEVHNENEVEGEMQLPVYCELL